MNFKQLKKPLKGGLPVSKNKAEFAVIVLAGGGGKRMKSKIPKVLQKVAGKPMLARTLEILRIVNPSSIVVVVNPKNIKKIKKFAGKNINFAPQQTPHGTADATFLGLRTLNMNLETVAVMYGDDTAFYKPETIHKVFAKHQKTGAKITFVTVIKKNPYGLGRIIRKDGKILAIVEEKDATQSQKNIKEINDGLYFFERNWLAKNLSSLRPSPVSGELYLTDLIELALKNGEIVETYKLADDRQWHGINTKKELAQAIEKFQKRIHIMGIGGAGAAAVAGIAQGFGYEVTGCDLKIDSSYLDELNRKQAKKGHNPSHLADVGMLIVSPAVLKLNAKNPELLQARKLKIPILTWQEFQGKYLQRDKFVIAVAGGYGKSTTTAMISKILIDTGFDPTCEIGASVLEWRANFRLGRSKYYICEADEYNDNFLSYNPDVAVILNIAWDHPDFFKTENSPLGSYKKFIANIKGGGYLIVGSDPKLIELSKFRKDIKVVKIEDFGRLSLSLIGDFRLENANAAITMAKLLKLDLKVAKKSIENFGGIGRRLEYKGEIQGVKVYDDYAVQPYTVLKTVNALKEKFKNQKVALVFEPHTFSRIETFFDEFVKNLKAAKADRIFITEVYPAREKGNQRALARKLTGEIGPKAIFTGSIEQTAVYLKGHLKDFGVVLSMGAGKAFQLTDLLKRDG